MALSPLDIRNKTFSTKMRGFNPEEVDDFLDQVITDYEEAIRQKRDLEKAVKHNEEKLSYFNELKDALNQSIIVAQDTADKLKENASKEASIIISTAEQQAKDTITDATGRANDILADATQKARRLAMETDDLKKKTRVFHQHLALLLETQLEVVRSDDWEELLKPFASYIDDQHDTFKEVLGEELEEDLVVENTSVLVEENLAETKELSPEEILESIKTTVIFPEENEPETEMTRSKKHS